jgi:ribosomal protein S18 acetylase RimI-like enzyme
MVAYAIRPLRFGDAATIVQFPRDVEESLLFFPTAAYPLSSARLLHEAAVRYHPTVVVSGGRVVGYANFINVGETCSIGNLIVAPTDRRNGVAQALLLTLETTAQAEYRARYVEASCFRHNMAALQLFGKCGYSTVGDKVINAANGCSYSLVQMTKRVTHPAITSAERGGA